MRRKMKTTEIWDILLAYISHCQCLEYRHIDLTPMFYEVSLMVSPINFSVDEMMIIGCNWLHMFTFSNRKWLSGLILLIPYTWTTRFVSRFLRDTRSCPCSPFHAQIGSPCSKELIYKEKSSHLGPVCQVNILEDTIQWSGFNSDSLASWDSCSTRKQSMLSGHSLYQCRTGSTSGLVFSLQPIDHHCLSEDRVDYLLSTGSLLSGRPMQALKN